MRPASQMMAIGGLRPALVLTQVVLTFGAAQLGGVAAAARYQQSQETVAQGDITKADIAFAAATTQVLADGTPHAVVDPVVERHRQLETAPVPARTFFIDRMRIDALSARAAEVQSETRQVAAAETQAEVQLNQQLIGSLKALRDLLPTAEAAGLDPAQYAAFADSMEKTNQQLTIPRTVQKALDQVKVRTGALLQATNDRVAANDATRQAAETARQAAEAVRLAAAALQAAKDSAQASLQGAQAALDRAKAIPILRVADNEKAIGDLAKSLSDKLAAQAPIAEFRSLSAALAGQTTTLNTLVNSRQATYDLLNLTRRELDAAQRAKNDVNTERSQLDALASQLDQSGDLGAITATRGAIQAIKNAVDARYLAALYGVGKVIVVSVTQERLVALQDGVVLLDTLVTTGRPSLPTVLGTFHVYFKSSPYHMCTPPQWKGTQYDYGCVDENWAMKFESSGYFIHDAPWRTHYGPGSDTESGGTHGCVNVPGQQMRWLYGWTDLGTPVITKSGDLPG